MEKKNNISKKMVLIIILLSIFGVGAITFGYFTVQKIGDAGKSISGRVQKKGPKITFTENKKGITLEKAYPMPDELGASQKEAYVFKLKNEENKDVNAKIIMEVTNKSDLDDSLVNISVDGTAVTIGTLTQEKSTGGYRNSYVLKTEKLTPGKEKEFTIKIWVNENGTKENAENKTWQGSILVVPEFA